MKEQLYREKVEALGRAAEIKKNRGATTSATTSLSRLLKKKSSSPSRKAPKGVECNVCKERPREPLVGECGHVACKGCWEQWERKCPGALTCIVCRQNVVLRSVTFSGSSKSSSTAPREIKL